MALGRPKKNVYTAGYNFRLPLDRKEELQKKINLIAAEEGLQIWEVIHRAVENYRLRGEKR